MLALYLVPVAIAVFGVNFGGGLVAALLSGVSIYWARADAPMFAHRHGVLAWDAAMCVVTLAVAAFGIDAFKETFGFLVADDYV